MMANDDFNTTRPVSPPVPPNTASTTIDATDSPSVSAMRELLTRGATIGRYVVLDKIGVGGMGVVSSAYDPELDRKLAIKLLSATDDVSSVRRRRLLREGQAMAKLTHPNVIAVRDVGTVDGQVFVAMAFIDGGTLGDWLQQARTWQQIVAIFIAAGRGLSAAHKAGLVHRDFKPDNVMVSKTGRVVVMDFGLARADAPDGEPSAAESGVQYERVASLTGLEATVTAAGAVMGTPAYMSAEQHEGRATDARSDQFAFCVAMYEALYGERPFAGEGLTALAVNVCCGNLREPPSSVSVPAWLRVAVLKGLAVDPDDRHSDMQALLAELQADRGGTPRRILPWLGAAALAGVGVAAGLWIDDGPAVCGQANGDVAATWNAGRAQTLHAAFSGTGLAFAEETWPAVREALGGYADALSAGYADACEARHVRNEQSSEVQDRRVACLARGHREFSALVALLDTGEPIAVENALSAVQGLPALVRCADAGLLSDATPPPDPEVAARVEALLPELGQVAALRRAGMVEAGFVRAQALAVTARELGYPPLHARAVVHLAALYRARGEPLQAERAYREALAVALRGQADAVAAQAAVELVAVVGEAPERLGEAEGWAEIAAALLGRTGSDPDVEARLLAFRASILRRTGRLREASDALQGALSQTERAHGPGDARVADASAELADVLVMMGERHRARELYERALKIDRTTVGAEHPHSASILHALGDLSLATGAYGPALSYHQRGLAIREAVRGEHGVELVDSLRALGLAYAALGRGEAASVHLARATAVAQARLGRNHAVTIAALKDQADARIRSNDAAQAITLLEDALSRAADSDSTQTQAAQQGRLEAVMGPRVRSGPDVDALRAALATAKATQAGGD
ncbi:MAG: serine/threonine protein kinase [Nannocystaceae bacterium]|nr:serine/threonine protein kinase [Nannocystaceae bacterium]